MDSSHPNVTIIMVSYNTKDLTIAAIRTCLETTRETSYELVVFDNASPDGSADAIAQAFPPADYPLVRLIKSEENLGFAKANNVVAAQVDTEFLLLLNPDTECHDVDGVGAVDALVQFAHGTEKTALADTDKTPGIWGGRTVFPDGRLNIASCWNRITPWSMVCRTFGLYSVFAKSAFFNSEAIGGWQRDSVRSVDIVVGCFLLIRKDLWDHLGGFDLKYYMYGEEADLCLRAEQEGYQPMITPKAQIMHLVGAAVGNRADKIIVVAKARATLIRDHWSAWQVPFGIGLMWLGAGMRAAAAHAMATISKKDRHATKATLYRNVWDKRADWLKGYV